MTTPSIDLITFADNQFSASAKTLCHQSLKCNFDSANLFTPAHIDSKFTEAHMETFSYKRGAGYWLWKPFIIQKSLNQLRDNDILLYLDAGVLLRKPAEYFKELAQKNEITLWREYSKYPSNNYWVDEKVWLSVVGSGNGYHEPHFWAGAILIRNSRTTRSLINNWLELCTKPNLLHPDSSIDYMFNGELIGHRHDQSLLNCILSLNRGIFNLELISQEDTVPFLIHRRGNVHSVLHAQLLQIIRAVFRYAVRLLPKSFRIWILTKVTKRRKPNISKAELARHQSSIFQ